MIITCKKVLLLFSLFIMCIIETNAQLICTGKMLDIKDGKIDAICFLRNPNPVGNKTKYTILFNGMEIYEVEFTYYKEEDSISIQFFDKENTIVKNESVKLKSKNSHFLICNYKPSIWPINDATQPYQILFGIDNPKKQFITLYQFQAIGGIQTQFRLQYVPDSVLNRHLEAVILEQNMDTIEARYARSVANLKRDMMGYKENIKKEIEKNEASMQLQEATRTADASLQKEFKEKLDTIFIHIFKNIYTFTNDDFDVEFNFNSNGYGNIKIDTTKTIFFKNGRSQKNWLKDSFMLKIKPIIERVIYKTLTGTYTNQNLRPNFLDWFETNFKSYENLSKTDFVEALNQIYDTLDSYETRKISFSTKYFYSFKYKSEVRETIWKYNPNDGTIKPNSKNEAINESLQNIFREKCSACTKGKYNVKICTVSINDTPMGQDIQIIKAK